MLPNKTKESLKALLNHLKDLVIDNEPNHINYEFELKNQIMTGLQLFKNYSILTPAQITKFYINKLKLEKLTKSEKNLKIDFKEDNQVEILDTRTKQKLKLFFIGDYDLEEQARAIFEGTFENDEEQLRNLVLESMPFFEPIEKTVEQKK